MEGEDAGVRLPFVLPAPLGPVAGWIQVYEYFSGRKTDDGPRSRPITLAPEARDEPASPPEHESVLDGQPRYRVTNLIASGTEGRVFLVTDRDLERRVAMKVMRREHAGDDDRVRRFLAEASRTSKLEHASIPSVYDVGYTSTGELYFTMRLVRGRTLADIFAKVKGADDDARQEWSLVRLVQILQQTAYALEYAHSQGLIHRDLKPANIAVGRHGEVLVLDWGLSRRVGASSDTQEIETSMRPDTTALGAVKGTPLYMSPEQARGEVDTLGPLTDVFALGAVLYEILCRKPPYEGASVRHVLQSAKEGRIVPPSVRVRGLRVPQVLEECAMRALSSDPASRQQSAAEFARDLQSFLEGTREREIRRREALDLLQHAFRHAERCKHLRDEADRVAEQAEDVRRKLPPWSPPDEKRTLWHLEDLSERLRADAAQAYAKAMDLTSRSLAHDPEHPDARELMARLYHERYVEALRQSDAVDVAWLRRMVDLYNDGPLDALLDDKGRLTVTSEPADLTQVCVVRMKERLRRVVEDKAVLAGPSPLAADDLPEGHYTVNVTRDGHVTARVPLSVAAGMRRSIHVVLPRSEDVPEGFVFVPSGPFLSGPHGELVERDLPGFLIKEFPVLLEEYALWIDHLLATDSAAVSRHVPWTDTHGPLLQEVGGRHVFCVASPLAKRPIPKQDRLPVVGVTRQSALEYAQWMSQRLGREVSLPTELQWEKAARGTDGRLYPWGGRFDATFCSSVDSTEEPANLRSVGAFEADVSPYGVRDMAGGVRGWCCDDVQAGRAVAVARGGAWYLRGPDCTAASRWLLDPSTRNPGIGFRLVIGDV